MKLVCCAALLSLLAPLCCAQSDKIPSVPTFCLATGSVEAKWIQKIVDSKSIEEVLSIAEKNECSVEEDDGVVYVIHEPSFGLKALKYKLSLFQDLVKTQLECFNVLDSSKVTPATYAFLVQQHVDSPGFKDIFERGKASLFMQPSMTLTLKNGNRELQVDTSPAIPDERRSALTSTLPTENASISQSLPKQDQGFFENGQNLNPIKIWFGGRPRSLYNRTVFSKRMMERLSKQIKALEDDLKEASTSFFAQAMNTYQADLWASGSPQGSGKFSDLSKQAQERLEMSLRADYQTYGFRNSEEALAFLHNSSITNVQNQASISFRTQKGKSYVQYDTRISLPN